MELEEKCLICELSASSEPSSRVSEKGLEGLVKASLGRRDGRAHDFQGKISGVVHVSCRKSYIRPKDIERAGRAEASTSGSGANLRSSNSHIAFKTKCLLCEENIDDIFYNKQKKLPVQRRRKVFHIRTLDFDQSLIKQAHARNDDWGEEILTRICNVPDLHAADAMYHDDCYKQFFLMTKPKSDQKRGRPQEDYVSAAMDEIFRYLDEKDNGQYSMDELIDQIIGEKPQTKWIKAKLQEKYGDRIIFSEVRKHKTVVSFRDVGGDILNAAWYSSRGKNQEEENIRVVQTAAAIIRREIQSQVYDLSSYPSSDDFLSGAEEMVTPTLQAFMEVLIPKKKRDQEEVTRKKVSIAHSIISAVRPRSFLSPVLLGIAHFIHRKFGSRNLINLLASMGLSANYYQTEQLQLSSLFQPQKPIPEKIFCQYVFDNADFNVATLDGLDTFHSLGGIKCVTPAEGLPKSDRITRLKSAPPISEVGKYGVLDLQSYESGPQKGLKNVIVRDLNNLNPIPSDALVPSLPDILWMCGKSISGPDIQDIPEWKGFMMLVCEQINSHRTAVVPLPFINSSPSDDDTLYTALKYAAEDATRHGLMTCFVTMDQPLYLKSREIIASNTSWNNIEMTLGGFHMLMSFLGTIGQTMGGSGLKELLCCVFAPNSVDKMLSGKAYSRAVRGHLLVQTTLAQIILERVSFTMEEKREIRSMFQSEEKWTPEKVSSNATTLNCVQQKLNNELSRLKDNGPTAALWVQYFNMITLMKKFISAQRCGDWQGHLSCAQQMIPYFHASGHFHYAKCTHLYVQDMLSLYERYSSEHELLKQYIDFGYFSVNRSDKRWAGVWSDMAIEQTLMCDMKSDGGLTRGRGLTDSVLAKWIGGARTSASICSSVETFAGIHSVRGEQHVDLRQSRIKRDTLDRKKLSCWLEDRPPFAERDYVMSLSTGIKGSSSINCYKAVEVGTQTMQTFVGKNFADIKQSRKNAVVPLSAMSSTITVNNVKVVVDPNVIFQRTLISKKSDEDVADLLKYELSPFPLSLFDEGCFRKTKKSSLYDAFPQCSIDVDLKANFTVVDGGFLLHRVKWTIGTTFYSIAEQYAMYIFSHYGQRSAVVFDGYGDVNSTKRAEQKRRGACKTSVEVNVTEDMVCNVKQEIFLTNEKNKTNLIELLVKTLTAKGIEATTATGDADGRIVRCGIDKADSESSAVVVIGEDIDLLVLLIELTPPSKTIFFMKPGRGNTETKLFSTTQIQELPYSESILFIHAFSGCDTTSAMYGKSKNTILKCFEKMPNETRAIASLFYNTPSSPKIIERAGEDMFLLIYQAAPSQKDLNRHRYTCFIKSSTKARGNLASLPPTKGAAEQHSRRVYLQIQQWLGNNSLDPEQWGWSREDDGMLYPIKTADTPAPANVLNSIFCGCATGCSSRCGCRKAGIHCSPACGCLGACLNSPPVLENEEDEDNDI